MVVLLCSRALVLSVGVVGDILFLFGGGDTSVLYCLHYWVVFALVGWCFRMNIVVSFTGGLYTSIAGFSALFRDA